MEHLSLEALARLVDETPFRSERRHLARCAACSGELDMLREQTEALGSLPDLRPAPGDWPALEARLESEGLLRGSGPGPMAIRLAGGRRAWMRAAAALVLFLAGGLSGAALAPIGPVPGTSREDGVAAEATTVEEAAAIVRVREERYYDAVRRYRALRDGESEAPMDPRRFAVYDALVAAGQVAVQEVPDDPYLNGFLVSAMAEREAALNSYYATTGRY